MDTDSLSTLLDSVLECRQEAFEPFVKVMTSSTQAWLQNYLGHGHEEALKRAIKYVEDIMVVLTSDKEVAALRKEGALSWLRRHRRDHFFPQMAYAEQPEMIGDRDDVMGTPRVRRLLDRVKRMDSAGRQLLHALVSENPGTEIEAFAQQNGLTVADVRIRLTAAATAVAIP